jgi:hypothetical protein
LNIFKSDSGWISARSKHPKQDEEAQVLYKKNFKQKAIDVLPADTDLNKVECNDVIQFP